MFCTNCGKEIARSASFCAECGSPVQADPSIPATVNTKSDTDKEQAFLNTTYKLLRWERNLWRIAGIIFLVFGVCYMLLFSSVIFSGYAPVGPEDNPMDAQAFFTFFILIYGVYGGSFVGVGIVNLVTACKIKPHLLNMRNDFAPTAKRLESVGRIVYTAIFGNYALIFYIINFVRMKSNKDTVNGIISKRIT